MQNITYRLIGTSKLMVNNPQTVNPFNVFTKQIKAITDKRKRTDQDNYDLMRLKWNAALYFDQDIGPYLPNICVWRAMLDAARISRAGKTIERGVQLLSSEKLPIQYEGPRDPDTMYDQHPATYVDVRDASPGGKRVTAVRPVFPVPWAVECAFMFDPNQASERDITNFLEIAGKVCGVGTYRRLYGRFDVQVVTARIRQATGGVGVLRSSAQ